MYPPNLYADQVGVWRDDGKGQPSGIPWDEVYRVAVVCIDTITRNDLILTLDWDYGHYLELNDEWPGFWEVATAITMRLPGVEAQWINQAKDLKPGGVIEIWKRP